MFESPKRLEGRQGSYLRQVDEATAIHDRMAENGLQFALALYQMHEDLMELAASMDRGRKHWKMAGLNAEKKVHESLLMLEKELTSIDSLFYYAAHGVVLTFYGRCSREQSMIRLRRNTTEPGRGISARGTLRWGGGLRGRVRRSRRI